MLAQVRKQIAEANAAGRVAELTEEFFARAAKELGPGSEGAVADFMLSVAMSVTITEEDSDGA